MTIQLSPEQQRWLEAQVARAILLLWSRLSLLQ